MEISSITFGSRRLATPFILKDLVKSGRVKLTKDFYGNPLTVIRNGVEISVQKDVDHLIPVAQGGTDAIDNLVLSTRVFNTHKDRKPLREVINIPAAIEHLKEVSKIKIPEFNGKEYADAIKKKLLDMNIYLDAPGVKKRRIDRPIKTKVNGSKKFGDRQFKKF